MHGELLERVLERDNLQRALKQVRRNQGAPGIDGMSVDELPEHLKHHWLEIKADILAGRYRPQPVRRVEIPKPDGRKRMLGIPTVLDRFIQQAIAQSRASAMGATLPPRQLRLPTRALGAPGGAQVQADVSDGHDWVVDLDLESFFDRVNHDRLVHRLGRHVADRGAAAPDQRVPEGRGLGGRATRSQAAWGCRKAGPLSPVLANVVLDELDWELHRRGHRFARYADDCNIAVRSERAGQRVMRSVTRFIEDSLRLTVNARKSAVDRPWNRKFLGFTLSRRDNELKVADKAIDKLKDRVRELSRRTRGQSLSQIVAELRETLLGWKAYFGITEVLSPLRELDKWIRRRLRCYAWKQWGSRGYRELRKRGRVRARSMEHQQERAWPMANLEDPGTVVGDANELLQRDGTARAGTAKAYAHAFNATNRRVRDPYARWCGREGP